MFSFVDYLVWVNVGLNISLIGYMIYLTTIITTKKEQDKIIYDRLINSLDRLAARDGRIRDELLKATNKNNKLIRKIKEKLESDTTDEIEDEDDTSELEAMLADLDKKETAEVKKKPASNKKVQPKII